MNIIFYKTMRHFFPSFRNWLEQIEDPRMKLMIDYSLPSVIWVGIMLFLMKIEARRQINFRFNTPEFISHINFLAGTDLEKMLHSDTLAYLLKRLPFESLCGIRTKMIKNLIRNRTLEKFRLLDRYYMISIDATGHLAFKNRHCPHCLVATRDGKPLYYYHNVLEAKLITENGLALSVATEFIENPSEVYDKQDCELRAFYRLAPGLKKAFPQLNICLLLDGIYAMEPTFKICKDYNWKYIVNFKEGSMPATFEEYELLKPLHLENQASVEIEKTNVRQAYNWVPDIDYKGQYLLNILECNEYNPKKRDKKETRFVWATNIEIGQFNFKSIAKAGRCRWKTENEGFNIQKNGGYNLEHAYSQNILAGKNLYLLLQIAHIINQLMEKGSLLKHQIKKIYGSIRNIARKLLEDFRTKSVDKDYVESILSGPFQIRFEFDLHPPP